MEHGVMEGKTQPVFRNTFEAKQAEAQREAEKIMEKGIAKLWNQS